MRDPAADLLPEGLEDRLPPGAAAAARIELAVLGVLDAHGYDRVRPPLIEFMQSMARRMDGVKTRHLFRFVDPKSLRTLALRMAAHTENARVMVDWLQGVDGVYDIRWPGISGMVSFRHPDAVRIVSSTRIFSLAESLGGVESLIEVPQAMTHQSAEGSGAAVPADLVRLSCGIEAAADLVADLRQAIGV